MARLNRLTLLVLSQLPGLCLFGGSCARKPPDPPFVLKQVGPNVWAAIDNPKVQPSSGANAGFVIGDDGVAVIDTFASVDAARLLLADIEKTTKLPIKYVINTHYHLDHVAGNNVFVAKGAVALAHRNVRDWIHVENLRLVAEGLAAEHQVISLEQRTFIESFVAPTIVYEDGIDLYLGASRLQVRSRAGHTGSDSIVIVPDAKVAFAGDLFWCRITPNTVDASTESWTDTLTNLAASLSDDVFVPGHGDVGHAPDVLAFRDYLVALRQLVNGAQAEGKSGVAVEEAVLPKLTAQYGQWQFFREVAPSNISQTDAELRGTKRIPKPATPQ